MIGNRRVLSRGDRQMGACTEPPSRDPAPAWVSRNQTFCSSGLCHIGVLTYLTSHPATGTKSQWGGGRQGKGRSHLSPRGPREKPSPLPEQPHALLTCPILTLPTLHPSWLLKFLLPPLWRAQLL